MTIDELYKQPPLEITPEIRKQIEEASKRPITPEEGKILPTLAEENQANFLRGMPKEALDDYLSRR